MKPILLHTTAALAPGLSRDRFGRSGGAKRDRSLRNPLHFSATTNSDVSGVGTATSWRRWELPKT